MEGLKMKYFVLNPFKNNAYGRASRIALIVYAKSIRQENKELAKDLTKWVEEIRGSFSLEKTKKEG